MCGLLKDLKLNNVPLSSIENLPPILISLFGDLAGVIYLIDTLHLGSVAVNLRVSRFTLPTIIYTSVLPI